MPDFYSIQETFVPFCSLNLPLRWFLVFGGFLIFGARPFDQGFGGPEEEYQFGEKVLLQLELSTFSHQVDVQAQLKPKVMNGKSLKSIWKGVQALNEMVWEFSLC